MLKNTEVQALIKAIGAGVGDEFDPAKVRYHKVICLADADVDGSHIRTLLLTFFFRQMRPLVEPGYVYIAQPPLFSTEVGREKLYLKNESPASFLAEHPNPKRTQRLKGLGEMDARSSRRPRWTRAGPSCRSPSKRPPSPMRSSPLMGDDVEIRKLFIQQNAHDVRFLDI